MAFFTLFALAVALATDAFAVAVTTGMQLRCVTFAQTARMALAFGVFQFAMPVAGWFLGSGAHKYIAAYDHWIAFALLSLVGGHMLKEFWKKRGRDHAAECAVCPSDPTKGSALLLLAVATSVDALAVGLTMALLDQKVWYPALIIGLVCCMLTACGMHLGRIMCSLAGNWSNRANAFGGLVLIGIGVNILREHGVFL